VRRAGPQTRASTGAQQDAEDHQAGFPEPGGRHGYNGAPHEAHAVAINPCSNCHSTVAHLKAFQVPDDCIKCHVHPQSQQGR